ncbi:MAG: HIRAN protein, partial [Gammaproteobacteria bacterium]
DRGAQLSARIVELRQSRDPWQRIRFEVVLDG